MAGSGSEPLQCAEEYGAIFGLCVVAVVLLVALSWYRHLLVWVVAQVSSSEAPMEQVVLITDAGEDLDDEMALVMSRFLWDQRKIELKAVIANLQPAMARARLVRGTLDHLGFQSVPVGVGTDGGSSTHRDTFSSSASTYIAPVDSQRAMSIEPGRALMHRVFAAAEDNQLTLLCVSSLKDAALFLRDNAPLFQRKLKRVVIMGGVDPVASENSGVLRPDNAHNNMFDEEASAYFYLACQRYQIPLLVVSRHAAYAAPIKREIYDRLAQTGSPIGWRLRKTQRDAIERLWRRACSAVGSEERQGLPSRCDKEWFSTTFCLGLAGTRAKQDLIWDLVVSFNMYDVVALIACSPSLVDQLFTPRTFVVDGVQHCVIGWSKEEPGVIEGKDLAFVIQRGVLRGIAAPSHLQKRPRVVLILSDALTEPAIMPTLLMLRALVEFNVISCMAVLIFEKRTQTSAPAKAAAARDEVLRRLGLDVNTSFMFFDEGTEGTEHELDELVALYKRVPNGGVRLVMPQCPRLIARFVLENPILFREKTEAVVTLGECVRGARLREADLEDDDLDLLTDAAGLGLGNGPAAGGSGAAHADTRQKRASFQGLGGRAVRSGSGGGGMRAAIDDAQRGGPRGGSGVTGAAAAPGGGIGEQQAHERTSMLQGLRQSISRGCASPSTGAAAAAASASAASASAAEAEGSSMEGPPTAFRDAHPDPLGHQRVSRRSSFGQGCSRRTCAAHGGTSGDIAGPAEAVVLEGTRKSFATTTTPGTAWSNGPASAAGDFGAPSTATVDDEDDVHLLIEASSLLSEKTQAAALIRERCIALGIPFVLVPPDLVSTCSLPSSVFDAMGRVGGDLGRQVAITVKTALNALWRGVQPSVDEGGEEELTGVNEAPSWAADMEDIVHAVSKNDDFGLGLVDEVLSPIPSNRPSATASALNTASPAAEAAAADFHGYSCSAAAGEDDGPMFSRALSSARGSCRATLEEKSCRSSLESAAEVTFHPSTGTAGEEERREDRRQGGGTGSGRMSDLGEEPDWASTTMPDLAAAPMRSRAAPPTPEIVSMPEGHAADGGLVTNPAATASPKGTPRGDRQEPSWVRAATRTSEDGRSGNSTGTAPGRVSAGDDQEAGNRRLRAYCSVPSLAATSRADSVTAGAGAGSSIEADACGVDPESTQTAANATAKDDENAAAKVKATATATAGGGEADKDREKKSGAGSSVPKLKRRSTQPLLSQRRTMRWSIVGAPKLPPECTEEWFVASYCHKPPAPGASDVWSAVRKVHASGCVALLAASGRATSRIFGVGTSATFSGVRHKTLALDNHGTNELRGFMSQLVLKAVALNSSEFWAEVDQNGSLSADELHSPSRSLVTARGAVALEASYEFEDVGTISLTDEVPAFLRELEGASAQLAQHRAPFGPNAAQHLLDGRPAGTPSLHNALGTDGGPARKSSLRRFSFFSPTRGSVARVKYERPHSVPASLGASPSLCAKHKASFPVLFTGAAPSQSTRQFGATPVGVRIVPVGGATPPPSFYRDVAQDDLRRMREHKGASEERDEQERVDDILRAASRKHEMLDIQRTRFARFSSSFHGNASGHGSHRTKRASRGGGLGSLLGLGTIQCGGAWGEAESAGNGSTTPTPHQSPLPTSQSSPSTKAARRWTAGMSKSQINPASARPHPLSEQAAMQRLTMHTTSPPL